MRLDVSGIFFFSLWLKIGVPKVWKWANFEPRAISEIFRFDQRKRLTHEDAEKPIEATMRCHGSNHDAAASLVLVSVISTPLILLAVPQEHLQINTVLKRHPLSEQI